jgi:iron complex outermembrane receptor protein
VNKPGPLLTALFSLLAFLAAVPHGFPGAGPPDLRITRISLERVVTAAVPLRLRIIVDLRNAGGASDGQSSSVGLLHRRRPDEPWRRLARWNETSLAPGETRQLTTTADFPELGDHYFRAEAGNTFEFSQSFGPVRPGGSSPESRFFAPDENQYVGNEDVFVTAPRMDVPLKDNPAAVTVVETEILRSMPKTIAADEPLKLVPGVKVDNQADGERVHMSIRGQGILTERGLRGIKVLLDGLPLNDPTGFAPDLFDVDWATVRRIEVYRGVAGALYGGGSSAGIVNIKTRDGAALPVAGEGLLAGGSYGFFKGLAQVGGTDGPLNYRVSASRDQGDGYRQHTRFRSDKFYGKLRFHSGPGFELTAIGAWTDYFNDNAEGLNLTWLAQDRRMANPDAITFNEYQRTRRFTGGLVGRIRISDRPDLSFTAYVRSTRYKESVPSSIQHRTFRTPGFSLQYNLDSGRGPLKNHFSAGADLGWQTIDEFRRPNLGLAVEGAEVLSDERIEQRGVGVYLLDRVELGSKWGVVFSLRRDDIRNELDDRLKAGGVDLSGGASFRKSTARIGLTWNPSPGVGLYASWGSGFLPPATEELANNPDALGGFNRRLVPATSAGEEVGARGSLGGRLYYDVALFHLTTENDFGRYRIESRPLETFYRNMGATRRYGLECFLAWYPLPSLAMKLAYTLSDFKYTSYLVQDEPISGTWLPNSPKHMGYFDAEYRLRPDIIVGGSVEFQSRSYIDQTNSAWVRGFTLLHVRLGYRFRAVGKQAELLLSGRNILGTKYIAFTEPDPDGNSYQPAPTGEATLSLRIFLGEK